MKILTISDKVVDSIYSLSIRERFGDVDLVLSCGDLPFYYLEFIVSMLNVPLYYVFGNHDWGLEHTSAGRTKTSPGGCVNLDGRVVEEKGLLIAGLEGSMKYNRWGRHQYTEAEMRAKVWRMAPRLLANKVRRGRYVDILITHAPPYGVHDGQDLCHTGFKAFLTFMERFKPKYLIHGHQHLHYNSKEPVFTAYGATTVVNAYGYRVIKL